MLESELKELLVRLVHARIHKQIMAFDWIPESMKHDLHDDVLKYLRKEAGLDPLVDEAPEEE